MAHYQDFVENIYIYTHYVHGYDGGLLGAGDCLIVTLADLETRLLKTCGSAASYFPPS